ncbi:MAG TPA: glycosyltransferase family 2 protein [Bdellovibrionota bacterium]|nr:glycosyltransferase family 2 protein [Bdellovibrionota bacterium]
MMKNSPVCDIILLSWNKLLYLQPCVESLFKHTKLPINLFIVDNGSGAETVNYLQKLGITQHQENIHLQIIYNNENLGFVGGMNQGMKLSTSPYVCLLNNDTLFTANWLELCLKTFESNPQIGIVNPNSTTFGVWPKKNQSVEDVAFEILKRWADQPITEIGSAVGFCMFIKREVIEKIGYLEESLYKFFFEDADYSKRAKLAGYKCVVANQAYVFHYEHKSFKNKKHRDQYFKQNQKWFYEKWGKPLRIFLPKKALSNQDREILTHIARNDHFIYVHLPHSVKVDWNDKHANISLIYHSFETRPELFFFPYKIIKRQKKPYDYIVAQDYPLLKKILPFYRKKIVNSLKDIKELNF